MKLDADTAAQIAAWRRDADPAKPLIICDADEVLLQFVATLEIYFERHGLYLDLASFALVGNVRHRETDAVVAEGDVHTHLSRFFATCVADCPPVAGAAAALAALAKQAQLVVLTNLPAELRAVREAALAGHDMPYKVITNQGGKGPAVRAMTAHMTAPVAFIDDLPPNLASVAAHAPEVHLVHFVADPRLAGLVDKPPEAHARLKDWAALERYLSAFLAQNGAGDDGVRR